MSRLLAALSAATCLLLAMHRAEALCTPCAEVRIVDRTTGQSLPFYWHHGERWIAGVPGHRYSVSLNSHSTVRTLSVVSVDGVNAVTGETASWTQAGYVLYPWQSFEILGWRKSQERVADFVFTAVDDSYAARTGRAANIGVIGVAVFDEWTPEPPPVAYSKSVPLTESAASAGMAAAPTASAPAAPAADVMRREGSADMSRARAPSIGTGHGQSETSVVQDTDFTRAHANPDEIIVIHYERPERLIAMGIMPAPYNDQNPTPAQPFPAAPLAGFVPDPPPRW